MDRRTKVIGGTTLALLLVGGGAGIAIATSGGEDRPLTGSALDRATAAALAETGGGTVLETEVGDDGAAYGVEVRLEDGSVVEVTLDADFRVTGSLADDDEGDSHADDDGTGLDG
jgi:hypothetical protein